MRFLAIAGTVALVPLALSSAPWFPLGVQILIHVAQRGGMTLTLAVPEVQPTLPPEVEQGVYRIAQEALANVTRHAGATQLAVTLAFNGAVTLIVSDNGRGCATAAVSGDHMGVQLMRERAQMLGGAFDVVSRVGGARPSGWWRHDSDPAL